MCSKLYQTKIFKRTHFLHFRFDFSRVSSNASRYLNEVSDLFLSKILKECGDGCNIAKSDKEITVQYTVQSNETNITWNTDESYRLDVVTNGKRYALIMLVELSKSCATI